MSLATSNAFSSWVKTTGSDASQPSYKAMIHADKSLVAQNNADPDKRQYVDYLLRKA